MNDNLGFEVMKILINAESVDELDEAIRVVNRSYPVLREQLVVRDEIKQYENLGLKVGVVML